MGGEEGIRSSWGADAAARRAAEEDLEGLEAQAKAALRRREVMERLSGEMEGWEGLPAVAAAWAEGEAERACSEARRKLEITAALRRLLELGRRGPTKPAQAAALRPPDGPCLRPVRHRSAVRTRVFQRAGGNLHD